MKLETQYTQEFDSPAVYALKVLINQIIDNPLPFQDGTYALDRKLVECLKDLTPQELVFSGVSTEAQKAQTIADDLKKGSLGSLAAGLGVQFQPPV